MIFYKRFGFRSRFDFVQIHPKHLFNRIIKYKKTECPYDILKRLRYHKEFDPFNLYLSNRHLS